MRFTSALAFAILAACSRQPQQPIEQTDTQLPVAIRYVSGGQLAVYARPDDKSEVVTHFDHAESVPILSQKGEWVEVRTALGTGWAHASELVSAEEGAESKENPNPKFEHAPEAIPSQTAHGTIYIEADVNTDGDVTGTTIISNSTGSDDLAAENAAALQRAKFYPIVIRGERKPFKYDYRVDY